MARFLSTRSQNPICFGLFCWKTKTKFPIFDQRPWTNPFGKMPIFTFLNRCILSLKWLDFFLQGHQTLCLGLFSWKKKGQNFQFLTNNHVLTPLENEKFSIFFKSMFCSLRWLDFNQQGHKTLCFGLFYRKTKQEQNFQFFIKNRGLTL